MVAVRLDNLFNPGGIRHHFLAERPAVFRIRHIRVQKPAHKQYRIAGGGKLADMVQGIVGESERGILIQMIDPLAFFPGFQYNAGKGPRSVRTEGAFYGKGHK